MAEPFLFPVNSLAIFPTTTQVPISWYWNHMPCSKVLIIGQKGKPVIDLLHKLALTTFSLSTKASVEDAQA